VVVWRPVRSANLTSAATSGSALARCQVLASGCSEAAQARYAAIMPAPTASWLSRSAAGRYQRITGRCSIASAPRLVSSV
jgi:hypothetical protein